MSLGDYLRLLRARKGGVTPMEIEAATGLTPGLYRYMEQRYRAIGDDETIQTLADYYAVPFESLRWRLDWPRKALSRSLASVVRSGEPITLSLWNGEQVAGRVQWWDLGAVALERADGQPVIVQRHAVQQWAPVVDEPAAEPDGEAEAD
jgi:sRNA-binding regulator protein Hfq